MGLLSKSRCVRLLLSGKLLTLAIIAPLSVPASAVAQQGTSLAAREAVPVSVHRALVAAASPDEVWRVIGPFESFGSWFPGAAGTTVSADGKLRTTTLTAGGEIVERLEATDPAGRRYTYSLVRGRLPANRYEATIRVLPGTSANTAIVEWSAIAEPNTTVTADQLRERVEGIIRTGFAGITERFPQVGGAPPGISQTMPRVVDLTHPVGGTLPIFPGARPFATHRGANYEQGYRSDWFEFGDSSTGTNMDAPLHFVPSGRSVADIAVRQLVAPLVIIDIREAVRRDPNAGVGAAEIAAWETRNGRIPEGAFVAILAGWSERFGDPARFMNARGPGRLAFPGFLPDAAPILIARKVAGAGVEAISADVGSSPDFAFHRAMLGDGRILVENLTNLDQLPATGATIVIGAVPIVGAAQSPARVIALAPR